MATVASSFWVVRRRLIFCDSLSRAEACATVDLDFTAVRTYSPACEKKREFTEESSCTEDRSARRIFVLLSIIVPKSMANQLPFFWYSASPST